MSEIHIAQIGVGNWGKNLLRNFVGLPNVRVGWICELDAQIREQAARQYPGIQVTERVEDVVDDPEISGVVIAAPPIVHYDLARRCLDAGKHVYVEKPMVLDVAHGEALSKLSARVDRHVMVGHLLEYHPAYLKVRDIIQEGTLGDVYYMYSSRVNLGAVRKDENSLWSFAPHDISVALMLLDQAPVRVSATGQAYLQPGVEDVTFMTLHFPDGKMAHIHVSWLDPHKIRKLTVVGSRKMVVVDDMSASERIRIYDKGVTVGQFVGYGESLTLRQGDIHIPFVKMQEPLRIECQHFIDCIRDGKRPRTDVENGLRVVRVLDAADSSLKSGGTPIDL